jgi:hypothetical protein
MRLRAFFLLAAVVLFFTPLHAQPRPAPKPAPQSTPPTTLSQWEDYLRDHPDETLPECRELAVEEAGARYQEWFEGTRVDEYETSVANAIRYLERASRVLAKLKEDTADLDTLEIFIGSLAPGKGTDALKAWLAKRRNQLNDQVDALARGIPSLRYYMGQALEDLESAQQNVEKAAAEAIAKTARLKKCERDAIQGRLTAIVIAPSAPSNPTPGPKSTPPASSSPSAPPGTVVVTLKLLDRTETVDVTLNANGGWNITSRVRQGIKLPSHDPAASDATSPVKVSQAATATVTVSGLPSGWQAVLGIGAGPATPLNSQNVCVTTSSCSATSGPYPGVRMGLGKGWAAGELAAVWLCRQSSPCMGRTDAVANINIYWTLP